MNRWLAPIRQTPKFVGWALPTCPRAEDHQRREVRASRVLFCMSDESTKGAEVVKTFTMDCLTRVIAFRRTLTTESDRGAALMAAAFLDIELRELLEFFLVEDRTIHERYFGYNGPCGAFSGRIDTAFLLGLISKSDHKDLTIIRKVRNDFAHVHEVLSFDTPVIRDKCRAMSWCGDEVEVNSRAKYIRSVMAVTSSIHSTYLLKPIFSERAHRDTLTRDDERELMELRDQQVNDILKGNIDYKDIPALAKRMAEDIERRQKSKLTE
jgi:hypothetical protein